MTSPWKLPKIRHDYAQRFFHTGCTRRLCDRPKGIVRAIIYYPLSTGRNFDELIRLVQALQTADEFGVATPPADWRPGDKVIVPPPPALVVSPPSAWLSKRIWNARTGSSVFARLIRKKSLARFTKANLD